MGYDLYAENKELESFHFGAFSFTVLLEACGYLFLCIKKGAQWFCVFGPDERMPQGDQYPRILSNDGFPVTEEEAKIMARIARNYVTVQRNLTEKYEWDWKSGKPEPWPMKIREDFVETFDKFADWAEKSGGFKIH